MRSARALAALLFPAPAGPSIVIIIKAIGRADPFWETKIAAQIIAAKSLAPLDV
jgi:hypothetical protein